MSGLLSYSGVVTKIRAMQSHFIDEEGFREIVSLPDVASIVSYLKKNPNYSSSLEGIDENTIHRGQLEIRIRHSLLRDFEKLYRFSNPQQKKFLIRYARRYEVKIIKDLLAHVLQGVPVDPEYAMYDSHFEKYSDLDVSRLKTAASIQELILALKDTPYYESMNDVYRRNPDANLFDYETALDLYHFQSLWKEREKVTEKGENEQILKEFLGTKYDMLNLWYIYRAKKYYHMDTVSIYALTIPVLYRLKKQDIRALVESDSDDAFKKALAQTYYGRTRSDLTPENLQYMYTKICTDVIRKGAEKHPNTIASLYSYLYLKEHELYWLVTAMECVRYKMAPEEALKYVTQR